MSLKKNQKKMKNKVSKAGDKWMFQCPACECCHYADNRWTFNGDLKKPTFSPSILVNRDLANPDTPLCHSFVTDGKIQFLNDCTHEMAGQTVELPDF